MTKFFIERPVLANVIAVLTVILGLVALLRLPVSQYPNVVPPTVQVTARYPGASAAVIAREVALLRAARAHALLLGRAHALPEDVQTLFIAVAAHRLVPDADSGDGATLAKSILHAVPVD
jgi:MoxR-like ATPase